MLRKISLRSFIVLSTITYSSCALIWTPTKQKVTVNSTSNESSVYLENEEIGKGTSFTTKVKKEGAQQIVVQTPGYKDEYLALIPKQTDPVWTGLRFLSFGCFVIPWYYESYLSLGTQKKYKYDKTHSFKNRTKYNNRTDQKYVNLMSIKLDVRDVKTDINYHDVYLGRDMDKAIAEAEKETNEQKLKQKLKDEKANKKKTGKLLDSSKDDNKITSDDTKFSENVIKTLKKTGYIDTVNQIFQDDNNTLFIEGAIKKVDNFQVRKNGVNMGVVMNRLKMGITWRVLNAYGEIVDSIDRSDFSGDFVIKTVYEDGKYVVKNEKMYADAVDISFQNLLKDAKFQKYLKQETYSNPKENFIKLDEPKNIVKDAETSLDASVIIKRKDKGHGSGFAITNNGYILTNYHVIADKFQGKYADFKVVTSSGEELTAKVVKVNRDKDLALIKVEKNFEKAFKLSKIKSFKKLQEVYCVGAPKSVELGQSVALGLISNERNSNNNNLLQLSMSVNPGNSGGPLFDKQGNLQGVIKSKLVGYATEGVGFAIPAYLIPDYLNISY